MVIKTILWHLFFKKRSVADSSDHCQVQIKVITVVLSVLSTVAGILVRLSPAVLWELQLALSEMPDVLEVGIITCDRCGLHLTFWNKKPRKDLQDDRGHEFQ